MMQLCIYKNNRGEGVGGLGEGESACKSEREKEIVRGREGGKEGGRERGMEGGKESK
jgi:hypothetical protein